MKQTFLAGVLLAFIFMASCDKKKETLQPDATALGYAVDEDSLVGPPSADNSRVSVDWPGVYEAIIPCADCPGIKTVLTLNDDNTFTISEEYLERKVKSEDKGTFVWDDAGSQITLNGKQAKYKYKVGENQLFQLDLQGNKIEGPNAMAFVFKKK